MSSSTDNALFQEQLMDWVNRIRAELQSTHDSIETLPVAKAMVDGTIQRSNYIALLEQLLLLHTAFEAELVQLTQFSNLITPEMYREETLRRDLLKLTQQPEATWQAAWDSTSQLIALAESWANDQPFRLLGMHYVLEGSRKGSMFLYTPLSKALHVPAEPGHGLDYHMEGLEGRPQNWMRFKRALGACPFTADQQKDVIQGAVETMKGLHAIYAQASANDEPVCMISALAS